MCKKTTLFFLLFIIIGIRGTAQTENSRISGEGTAIYEQQEQERVLLQDSASSSILDSLPPRQQKAYLRQMHRDSVRAGKKVWLSVFGGPSYNPEASLGIGGAVLATFRMNKNDTLSQRSYLPAGINISINGTIVVAGAGTFFFNANKFRIYTSYSYRNEPAHYYGKGYESIEKIPERGKQTTRYHKETIIFNPRFVWEVRPNLYTGPLLDINYSRSWNINPLMQQDPYFLKFRPKYMNVGIGAILQYDTRDDVATPNEGLFLSGIGRFYGKYFGGAYNYQILELEYRQFQPLFRRAVLAWTAKTQIGFNNIPFTELPTFGSPFDLRGYFVGQYRDKSMAYGIVEYRQMFGTEEDLKRGRFLSKLGFVTWVGTGTIGNTPAKWTKWKLNYGVGLRVQMQPRKNFRLDVGKAQGVKGVQVYMNMTEAF